MRTYLCTHNGNSKQDLDFVKKTIIPFVENIDSGNRKVRDQDIYYPCYFKKRFKHYFNRTYRCFKTGWMCEVNYNEPWARIFIIYYDGKLPYPKEYANLADVIIHIKIKNNG